MAPRDYLGMGAAVDDDDRNQFEIGPSWRASEKKKEAAAAAVLLVVVTVAH